ncbi:hypothetical protein V3C99_015047 [Haemonchus contortus]|uniref:Molybdopterin-converting factor subunit 2 n=1 Tax=Haemonchus contortus TaxID=6289 RepID=A0A7I4YVK9_HAECO
MLIDRRYPEVGDVGCDDLAVTVVVGAAAVSPEVGDVTVLLQAKQMGLVDLCAVSIRLFEQTHRRERVHGGV